jgi:hypothetical protein
MNEALFDVLRKVTTATITTMLLAQRSEAAGSE